jgi:REP element-mobilizing transposase RayT
MTDMLLRVAQPATSFSGDVSGVTSMARQANQSEQQATLPVAGVIPPDWDFQQAAIAKRAGAYLPHWSAVGATYAVTFRLADSLPFAVLEALLGERKEITLRAQAAGRDLTFSEASRLRELHAAKIEGILDAGQGSCLLRQANVAQIVKNALAYFNGERYDILAWCIMPNHVHVVVCPRPSHELPTILHSWKSFTSNQINKLMGRSGPLWQAEYFDHLIRDADDLERSIRYVLENPRSAGLCDWPWSGRSL